MEYNFSVSFELSVDKYESVSFLPLFVYAGYQ